MSWWMIRFYEFPLYALAGFGLTLLLHYVLPFKYQRFRVLFSTLIIFVYCSVRILLFR